MESKSNSNSDLVSINKYCIDNDIDLYVFLSLVRRANVLVLKIGNVYFVKNQRDLDLTLEKRFEDLESFRKKRKLKAQELAAARKVATNLRKKLMEFGLTPDQISDLSNSDGDAESLYDLLSKGKTSSQESKDSQINEEFKGEGS